MNAITALQRLWDGTQWVKAKGDSAGRLVVQPRRQIWVPRFTYWFAENISPGTTLTVTDQSTVGSGRISGMRVYVDGEDWASAGGLQINLTIDGTLAISQNWPALFNCVRNVGVHTGVYTAITLADGTEHIYDAEIILNAEFGQGFKVDIKNTSTTTNITRCIVHILWGIYQEL